MAEAIKVESQAQQPGLADLNEQAAAWNAGGELAFDGGEYRFNQGSPSVLFLGDGPPHLGSHSVDIPRLLVTLGRDDGNRPA